MTHLHGGLTTITNERTGTSTIWDERGRLIGVWPKPTTEEAVRVVMETAIQGRVDAGQRLGGEAAADMIVVLRRLGFDVVEVEGGR